MIIRIDQRSEEPLYLQLCAQIIEAIAIGDLAVGEALPSVRALANDLGINLHTVNKAYAVLRDEGYLVMKGRKGASVADPTEALSQSKAVQTAKSEEALRSLALAWRAHGGTLETFLAAVNRQANEVFGKEA